MAHFYGSMNGSRGEATRCGTKSSGISAHVRSWTHGVRSNLFESRQGSGEDKVCIEITSGSNNDGRTSHIFIEQDELNGILAGRLRLAVVPNNGGGDYIGEPDMGDIDYQEGS